MSDYLECPFDRSHLVAAKSFSHHIVKCQRQNPDVKLARCPLNTSHLVQEQDLKRHLKDCPSRVQLEVYKFNVSMATSHEEEIQTEPLILNTDESGSSKEQPTSSSSGNTLQQETECWDDFTYKAYDPLEKCKAKKEENEAFIIPNANQFVGKGADAVLTKDDGHNSTTEKENPTDQRKPDSDGNRTPDAGYEFGDYDRNLEQFGLSRNDLHRRASEERLIMRQAMEEGSREEHARTANNAAHSGRSERNDGRYEDTKSNSRRYETARERRSEGHPYMNSRDRPRSNGSRDYNERHNERYNRKSGGYASRDHDVNAYRQSYDNSYYTSQRDRYVHESNTYSDRDSSRRYRNSYSSQDNRPPRASDGEDRDDSSRKLLKREPTYERGD